MMEAIRPVGLLSALVLAMLSTGTAACAQDLSYPETPRSPVVDSYFGQEIEDPYRWLEDMDSPETTAWARAQDALSAEFVADVASRVSIEQRLLTMAGTGSVGTPLRGGDRYFFTRTEPGAVMPVVYVQEGITGEAEILFDASDHFDLDARRFRRISPGPEGKHLVVMEGRGQSRWYRIRVFDVEERRFADDVLGGYYSGRGGIAWLNDGSGFFYTRYDEPASDQLMEATVTNSRIFLHRLGTAQTDDALVFETPDNPMWLFWPRVSLDGRYLVITEASAPATRIFFKDLAHPGSAVEPLTVEADATYGFEANDGSHFILSTTLDAPNSRLIRVDSERPERAGWEEIVPEDATSDLRVTSQIGGRLLLRYTKDARPFARVHALDGEFLYDVELPAIGLIGGFADDERPNVFYRFNSLFDPGSVYHFHTATGRSSLFARPNLPFNPEDFAMEQVFFRSADGIAVPMFIAHRKELERDRTNPVFMYGYGAYKWSAFPGTSHTCSPGWSLEVCTRCRESAVGANTVRHGTRPESVSTSKRVSTTSSQPPSS